MSKANMNIVTVTLTGSYVALGASKLIYGFSIQVPSGSTCSLKTTATADGLVLTPGALYRFEAHKKPGTSTNGHYDIADFSVTGSGTISLIYNDTDGV